MFDSSARRHASLGLLALLAIAAASCGGGASGAPGLSTDVDLPFLPEDEPRTVTMGRQVVDLDLIAPDGTPQALLDGREEPLVVIAFTQVGCPVARRYGPRLIDLHERFADRGVAFVGVDGSPQDDLDEIEAQRAELGIPFTYLRDEDQALVRQLDIRTTTEVVVLDDARRIRYRGAIADQFEVDEVRKGADHEYLEDALEALLEGRAPEIQLTQAPGCILTRLESSKADLDLPRPILFHEHVEPVLRENCVPCHRAGQVAPFALDTYDDAAGWSAMIAMVVEEGIMPPWPLPSLFDADFHGERTLTERERALISGWADGGLERGDPAAAAPPSNFQDDWSLEGIDLVIEADQLVDFETNRGLQPLPSEGYHVAGDVSTEYVDFATSQVFGRDVWVDGIEVLPTARPVVHHILVSTVDPKRRRREAETREERLERLGATGYFGIYVPGSAPSEYQPGYAKLIPKGSALRFSVHYTPDGAEHFDRPRIALRMAQRPPRKAVWTASVGDFDLRIAPGDPAAEFRASVEFAEAGTLMSITPHMHYRGKEFRMFLRDPDGFVRSLVGLDWDFDWQGEYRFREPIDVRAGSELIAVGTFDNSAANRSNPDPTATVRFGRRSEDEMFIGYFDYAVANRRGRP
ncbi:MAG: redoxin domain-containing protein [Planctomycetota bacterium]